jgi:hypothetical protein
MKLLGVTEPYRAPSPTPVPGPDPAPIPQEPVTPDSPNPPDQLPSYEDPPPVNPVASRTLLREGAECGFGPAARTRNVA